LSCRPGFLVSSSQPTGYCDPWKAAEVIAIGGGLPGFGHGGAPAG